MFSIYFLYIYIYIYMFWQDKHFLSCANTANEIELLGWIEWMCRMRVRVRKGGWSEIRGGGAAGGREGLAEGRVKEKEDCSARWAVRWAKAFRDYNRLVTGQSGGHVVRNWEALLHLPQLDRSSDPSSVCASLPVPGSACSETSCWGEKTAADWTDADWCWWNRIGVCERNAVQA